MTIKLPRGAMVLLALALGAAHAAEVENGCRLRGGSLVPLPAEACAKEGGTLVTGAASAPAAAASPAEMHLSANPRLAAAQKAIIELLRKPVADQASSSRDPEGIERTARFDECKLTVEESLRLDYGNFVSARKRFKISSAIDFSRIGRDEFGVLGKVSSKGGGLKAHAVYLEEQTRRGSNAISISVAVLRDGEYGKFMPGPAAYWDAPREDLWMADVYGYVKANEMGEVATDKVRILFIVGAPGEASALEQGFEELQAACRP